MSEGGAKYACQIQNKRSSSCQRFLPINAENNTNVQLVEKKVGYLEEGHQLKVFIDFCQTFSEKNIDDL